MIFSKVNFYITYYEISNYNKITSIYKSFYFSKPLTFVIQVTCTSGRFVWVCSPKAFTTDSTKRQSQNSSSKGKNRLRWSKLPRLHTTSAPLLTWNALLKLKKTFAKFLMRQSKLRLHLKVPLATVVYRSALFFKVLLEIKYNKYTVFSCLE